MMVEYLTFARAVKTYHRDIDNDSLLASQIASKFALKIYLNSLSTDYKLKNLAEFFNDVSKFVYTFRSYWHMPKIIRQPTEEDKVNYLKWLSGLPLVITPLGLRLNPPVSPKVFCVVECWGNILALLGAGIVILRVNKDQKLQFSDSIYSNNISDFLALCKWALENTRIKEDGRELYRKILNYCLVNKLTTQTKIDRSYKKFKEWCDFGFF